MRKSHDCSCSKNGGLLRHLQQTQHALVLVNNYTEKATANFKVSVLLGTSQTMNSSIFPAAFVPSDIIFLFILNELYHSIIPWWFK